MSFGANEMTANDLFPELQRTLTAFQRENKTARLVPFASRARRSTPVKAATEANSRDQWLIEVALPGLYGSLGALPDYFTDHIHLAGDDEQGLREFLDIFNHRLITTTLEIWQRYHFFVEDLSCRPYAEWSRGR